jgi:hypothetical protein
MWRMRRFTPEHTRSRGSAKAGALDSKKQDKADKCANPVLGAAGLDRQRCLFRVL